MAPGVVIALIVIAGVAIGIATPIAPGAACAAALALSSLALIEQPAREYVARTAGRGLLATALFALSILYGATARDRALAPPLVRWFDAEAPDGRLDVPVLVRGTLTADARVTDAGVRVSIDVHQIHTAGGWRAAAGRVQAHVAGELALLRQGFGASLSSVHTSWTRGRPVEVPIVLRRPQVWLNPGAPSTRWQRLRQRFDLAGSIKSGSLVTVSPASWWDEAAAAARRHVRNANARFLLPRGGHAAAIAAAILIGDRAGLSDEVEQRLQAAGTYHVIAISGGNVALIAAICFGVVRWLIRSSRAGVLICIGVIVAYGVVVGGEASVTRAVVAACVYLAVTLWGLRPHAINVLALVALLLVVADPIIVIDVGAWLSFGATLGIVLWASRIHRRIASLINVRFRVMTVLIGVFAATVAAEVMLLPISAAVFARVSVAGLICNFIAIPAMAVVQIAGLVMIAASSWPIAASCAAWCADVSSRVLIGSADLVTLMPWMSWRVPPPPLIAIAFCYASLAAATTRIRQIASIGRHGRYAVVLAAVASIAVVLFAPGLERAGPAPHVLRVTMLDVGQGDSVLVQFPDGHSLLVDSGGTSGSFDLGGRIVGPALWALGVRRLDWLAITHPDVDHIGGAAAVAADFSPREVWEGVPVPPNPLRAALVARARDQNAVWRQLLTGHTFDAGGVLVDARHPPAPEWERQRTRNDDSLVLRLRYDDVELLLTGDAGAEFERHEMRALEAEEARAPLRILKVGHHGSLSASAVPFLRALHPHIALVSAGRANLFGHPAPDIVARLEALDAEIFRTDRDGAVILETDGTAVWVRTMMGRTWELLHRPRGR